MPLDSWGKCCYLHLAPEIKVSCEMEYCCCLRRGVHGHPPEFILVHGDGRGIYETPCQTFEVIPPAAIRDVSAIPKTIRIPHKIASLKDAKSTI